MSGKTIAKTPVTIQLGSSYTLTASVADITGLSMSLTPGNWEVSGTFEWVTTGAGDVGAFFTASLATTGGTATITPSTLTSVSTGIASFINTTSATWTVNVVATATVKGQATKSGGAGTSTLASGGTVLVAVYVGQP